MRAARRLQVSDYAGLSTAANTIQLFHFSASLYTSIDALHERKLALSPLESLHNQTHTLSRLLRRIISLVSTIAEDATLSMSLHLKFLDFDLQVAAFPLSRLAAAVSLPKIVFHYETPSACVTPR